MTVVSLIAVIDENNGLGKNNHLLCHLPADLKRFKNITMGKPVIMGRKTYESIGKPLPGRLNIVLTHQKIAIEGVQVVESLSRALTLVADIPEVMVIGGAEVFKQALPYATRIYLTVIHHRFAADVFFPQLTESSWCCEETEFYPRDDKNLYDITFYQYYRN